MASANVDTEGNAEHRHTGIALLTPEDVRRGRSEEARNHRRAVLHAAYARNSKRFVNGTPEPPALQATVFINPPNAIAALHSRPKLVSNTLTHSGMCLNARKLARTLTNRYDEALKPSGLKMTQFSVLAHARAFGEIGLSELADAMDLDQTTLSRNVELLRRDGFLAVAKSGLVASSYLPRRAMHSSNMPIRSGKPHSSKP